MTRREQVLAGSVGAMMGIFVLYAIVDWLFLAPAAEADQAVPVIKNKIDEHKHVIARGDYYAKHLRKFEGRTFGKDRQTVKEEMRACILGVARKSDINTRLKWYTSAFTGKRRRGVYQEVGWTVKARGSLESVVNFLHLLEGDPRLHRVEAFNLSPIRGHGDMNVSLRYVSLVLLDPKVVPKAKGSTAPASRPAYPQLASAQRELYDSIVRRDMFRPYVKRLPVQRISRAPRQRVDVAPPPPPPPRKPPIETRLKIVSLAQFGRPEVCLFHLDTEKIWRYAEGDKLDNLVDWQIAMVDYRVLPHPDNPNIDSSSRAIVKVGTTYWAVELGQTLSRKHRLGPEQLPEQLPEKLQAPPVVVPPEEKVSASADNV